MSPRAHLLPCLDSCTLTHAQHQRWPRFKTWQWSKSGSKNRRKSYRKRPYNESNARNVDCQWSWQCGSRLCVQVGYPGLISSVTRPLRRYWNIFQKSITGQQCIRNLLWIPKFEKASLISDRSDIRLLCLLTHRFLVTGLSTTRSRWVKPNLRTSFKFLENSTKRFVIRSYDFLLHFCFVFYVLR